MIGPRLGPKLGGRLGVALGLAADAISAGGAAWSIDGGSSKAVPASAAEWSAFAAANALTGLQAPTSLWGCQEASGNLGDVISGVTLTQNATGHLYQQSVPGWSRLCVKTIDGTANQKWVNTTTAANAGTESIAMLAYILTPSAAPAATRTLYACGTTLEHRIASGLTAARLTVQAVNTDGAAGFASGAVRPVLLCYDRTGGAVTLSTDESNMAGTYSAAVTGVVCALGASGATPANAGYLYACQWKGAAAEWFATIGNRRAMLQAAAWTIPW